MYTRDQLKIIAKDANTFRGTTEKENKDRIVVLTTDTDEQIYNRLIEVLSPIAEHDDFGKQMKKTSPTLLDFMLETCMPESPAEEDSNEEGAEEPLEEEIIEEEPVEEELAEEEPAEEEIEETLPEPDIPAEEETAEEEPVEEDAGVPTDQKLAAMSQPGNMDGLIATMEKGFADMVDATNRVLAALEDGSSNPPERPQPTGTQTGTAAAKASGNSAGSSGTKPKALDAIEKKAIRKCRTFLKKEAPTIQLRAAFCKKKGIEVKSPDSERSYARAIMRWFVKADVDAFNRRMAKA